MKACVVDDDRTSLELLSDFLEDEECDVVRFTHPDKPSEKGTRLVEEVLDKNTKILIMDVRFGREDHGLTKGLNAVMRLVEENRLISGCTVVFVSQFGRHSIQTGSVANTLRNNGIGFHWLDKPVDYVLLKAIIRQC